MSVGLAAVQRRRRDRTQIDPITYTQYKCDSISEAKHSRQYASYEFMLAIGNGMQQRVT